MAHARTVRAIMDEPGAAHRVTDEVADVLAYLLQFCAELGIDPLRSLAAKIERNEERFPVPAPAPDPGPDSPETRDRHSSE